MLTTAANPLEEREVPEYYDVIVIGSGAGGGSLAYTVADSGKRFLLLERGSYLPREPANWDASQVFVDGRYISKDTWYDADGSPFQPQVHYFVGGATKLYGAALYRLGPRDFGELRHVDGASLAWPVSYDDFEPYYTRGRVAVSGPRQPRRRSHGGSLEEAVSMAGRVPRAAHSAVARGTTKRWLPPVPRAVWHLARRGRSAEQWMRSLRDVRRVPVPCAREVDAETIAVRPLLGRPNVRLLVDAEVTSLETDASGRQVTQVVVSRHGDRRSTRSMSSWYRPARRTAQRSCCAPRTTAIPNRLANGSDQVGRDCMYHNSKAVVALTTERNDTVFQKTLALKHFYFRADDYEWPIGQIEMVGTSNAVAMKGEEPKLTKLAPHWSLDEVAHHAVDFWLTTEDLPNPENRVTLDGDGNIRLAYTSNNDAEANRLYHELKKILNHVGMAKHHVLDKNFYMNMSIAVAGVAHQAGTCRFGNDPKGSVLDPNCKAHELDNLYAIDTSFFPSIGAVKPALTATANEIRVGEHLIERMA